VKIKIRLKNLNFRISVSDPLLLKFLLKLILLLLILF